MVKNPTLKLLIGIAVTFFFQYAAYSQTGGIPTGTDTVCATGISLYQKLYRGANADLAEWLTATTDSGYVIAGQTNSFGNGGYDGFLTKVNKRGNTVWSKALGGSGNDVLYGIKATSDNGFIAVGITKSYGNAAGDAWLVKTDAAGNVQWSKKYGNGNINGEAAFEVVQLSDGGYAFCGAHQFAAGVTESFVVRTDNLGNVIWSKQYGHTGSDEAWGIMEDGSSLVVVGFYRAPDLYDGYVMKLDKTTGAVLWKRTYDAELNRHLLMAKVRVTNTGYQVFSFLMDDFNGTNLQQCIWNLASDGTVQNVRKIAVPGVQTSGYGWVPQANGGFVVANGENNNNADIIFTQVNSSGNIGWSRKHSYAGRQWVRAMIASPEWGYTAVGISNNAGTIADSSDVYLIRIDSSGNGGTCSGVSTTEATVVTVSFTTSVISTPSLADVTISNPVITAGSVSFLPATNTLCFYCQPKPTGTARPVSPGGDNERTHDLSAYPNPVFAGSVNLQIDAVHNDLAVINLVDISGTVMYSMAPREIVMGQNIIKIDLPLRMQNYSNYFISVQFRNYSSSVKIFVIR